MSPGRETFSFLHRRRNKVDEVKCQGVFFLQILVKHDLKSEVRKCNSHLKWERKASLAKKINAILICAHPGHTDRAADVFPVGMATCPYGPHMWFFLGYMGTRGKKTKKNPPVEQRQTHSLQTNPMT